LFLRIETGGKGKENKKKKIMAKDRNQEKYALKILSTLLSK